MRTVQLRIQATLGAALLGIVVAVQPLAAQQRTDMVPTILATSVLSIFGGMFGGAPTLMNGTVPTDWPAALVPASPARVIGGATIGFMRLALFSYPGRDDPMDRYESLLASKGARRAASSSGPDITHGFAPSDAADEKPHAWCLKDGAVQLARTDSVHPRRAILVTWVPLPGTAGVRTPCNPDASMMSAQARELILPPLIAPRGLRVAFEGSGGNSERYDFYASTDTTWRADSLISHYGREFAKGGWIVGRPMADAETGVLTLTKPDAKSPWRGSLSVITGSDRRQLVVRMLRARAN